MPRVFHEQPISWPCDRITITGDDCHHLFHVLRMKPGDRLIVCDGQRSDYHGIIESLNANQAVIHVEKRVENQAEPPYQAVLYQGLARGDRMDILIQKAVELGVRRIVPVRCQRSVVRLTGRDAERKTQRWQKIALEAARQCGRGVIPQVDEPVDFSEAVAAIQQADLAVFPWESERRLGIRTYLEQQLSKQVKTAPVMQISILIGPEGGFALEEAELVVRRGIFPVSLGQRILRTETAGIVVLAMLAYQFNDF